jgi:hypothetical protein
MHGDWLGPDASCPFGPENEKKAYVDRSIKSILRVDRKFKSHGPQELRRAYRKRVAVERVFSRLKNLAGLTQHNMRGLARITFHAQLCLLTISSQLKQPSTRTNHPKQEA